MKNTASLTYIDISPPITNNIAVFPGDVPYKRSTSLDCRQGDPLTLSSIQTTLHLGAHADGPIHFHAGGSGIDERPLGPYLGPCQVIQPQGSKNGRIYPEHIAHAPIDATRILLCTNSFPNPDHWNPDFLALSPELIRFLSASGVKLVGIDTPSVDPASSKALESHQALYDTNCAVLEGLVLHHVPPKKYFLIALPLRFSGADASPVRAVLLDPSQAQALCSEA